MSLYDFSAQSLYGGSPAPQPTSSPRPDHPPGSPAPFATTVSSTPGLAGNPTMVLVAMLGLAAVLIWRLKG